MKATDRDRIQQRISDLTRDYKKQGYEVIENPNKKDLPYFLKNYNYIPDLIVKSSKDNFIIEVKSGENLKDSKKLSPIADIINKNENWEFVLIVTIPKESNIVNKIPNLPSTEVAVRKFNLFFERKDFTEYFDMIFLYGWSIVQSLLLQILGENGERKIQISPKAMLREGFSQGYFSKKDYNTLIALSSKRNSIVHGDFSIAILKEDIYLLKSLIQKLYKTLIGDNDSKNHINYLKSLDENDLEYEIDSIISDSNYEIVESEKISSRIAETNAFAYYVDDYSINEIKFASDSCVVKLSFSASGEQDEDRPFCGSKISGEAIATIDEDGNVLYSEIIAEVDNF